MFLRDCWNSFANRLNCLILLLVVCGVSIKSTLAGDRIRLSEVKALTLYNGQMTTGRRSSPVPQLKCGGGSAGCSTFAPHAVQCYNRGWDGYHVQWECKTDMDYKYKFGRIHVNCEGYDYPDDPYILRGSCGLEYTIELTEEGYEKQRSSDYGWGSYHHQDERAYYSKRRSRSIYGFGDLVMLVIVGGILYMIYSTCTANRNQDTGAAPPPYTQDPSAGRGDPRGPGAHPPPYSPDEPGFKREYAQGTAPPPSYPGEPGFRRDYTQGAAGSSSSGFWTGAATGGLLGYLLGGRNSGSRYYHNPYSSGWGSQYYSDPYYRDNSGWFGNWFSGSRSYGHRPSSHSYGFSSFGSSSRSSSGSRTTSGMGGTSRR